MSSARIKVHFILVLLIVLTGSNAFSAKNTGVCDWFFAKVSYKERISSNINDLKSYITSENGRIAKRQGYAQVDNKEFNQLAIELKEESLKNPLSKDELYALVSKHKNDLKKFSKEKAQFFYPDPVYDDFYVWKGTFQSHFSRNVPSHISAIITELVEAIFNADAIAKWMEEVHQEVFEKMWQDGFRSKKSHLSHVIRERYLDLVLAQRAKRFGLSIDEKKQLPFNVFEFNTRIFFNHIKNKHIVLDWTGKDIVSGSSADHHVRGHLLAMTYAAEFVSGFGELLEYIGKTQDRDRIWTLLFDDGFGSSTPVWNGFWVTASKRYFHIRY